MSNKSIFLAAGLALLATGERGAVDLDTDQHPQEPEPKEDLPPRILSSDIREKGYHPSCLRVGVKVNGEVKNNVTAYDQDKGEVTYQGSHVVAGVTIETYWRYPESRQQRRARQRWETEHADG